VQWLDTAFSIAFFFRVEGESCARVAVLQKIVRLKELIKLNGVITFCEWMEATLYEEPDGYYVRSDKIRWGRKGDYRTAPEISPSFAATFASYFAKLFEEQKELTIMECGAGNGVFAFEVLQTLQKQFPSLFNSTRYLIDERSETSRQKIKERLQTFSCFEFCNLKEISIPLQNAIVFSNELIDAFAVHRVVLREGKLKEIFVDVNSDDEFVLIEKEPSTSRLAEYIAKNKIELTENQTIEINLAADDWLKHIAGILKSGYVITVDYGATAKDLYDFKLHPNGTLRAFSKHQFDDDWLSHAGEVDLTTTVNWTAFQKTGEENNLETISFEPLGKFLLRVGILEQLEKSTDKLKNEIERIQLRSSIRDLILPNGLGETHQVFCFARYPKTKAEG
jgi:SAM-dependent MidA family methyltransferase